MALRPTTPVLRLTPPLIERPDARGIMGWLPIELHDYLFQFLDPYSMEMVAGTCRLWRDLVGGGFTAEWDEGRNVITLRRVVFAFAQFNAQRVYLARRYYFQLQRARVLALRMGIVEGTVEDVKWDLPIPAMMPLYQIPILDFHYHSLQIHRFATYYDDPITRLLLFEKQARSDSPSITITNVFNGFQEADLISRAYALAYLSSHAEYGQEARALLKSARRSVKGRSLADHYAIRAIQSAMRGTPRRLDHARALMNLAFKHGEQTPTAHWVFALGVVDRQFIKHDYRIKSIIDEGSPRVCRELGWLTRVEDEDADPPCLPSHLARVIVRAVTTCLLERSVFIEEAFNWIYGTIGHIYDPELDEYDFEVDLDEIELFFQHLLIFDEPAALDFLRGLQESMCDPILEFYHAHSESLLNAVDRAVFSPIRGVVEVEDSEAIGLVRSGNWLAGFSASESSGSYRQDPLVLLHPPSLEDVQLPNQFFRLESAFIAEITDES